MCKLQWMHLAMLRQGQDTHSLAQVPVQAPSSTKLMPEPVTALCLPALRQLMPDLPADLEQLLGAVARASKRIADTLRTGDAHTKSGIENTFGDEQLHLDVVTNEIAFEELRACGLVHIASSEETPTEEDLGAPKAAPGEGFSVSFDPLDGSSIIDTNFSVGSIFGVWPGRGLLGRTGREQVSSILTVYGPRVTLVIALPQAAAGPRTVQLMLQHDSTWEMIHENLRVAPAGKIFAPGNLRATADNAAYKQLVDFWIAERYTLRYTGGLVPDVYHVLIKGKGVVTNVVSAAAKAKLRLLYEAAPIALVMECAGAASCTAPGPNGEHPEPISILDLPIMGLEFKCGVAYGGVEEVAIFTKLMYPGS
ncbi:sedoheptulose- -bisphosphatase [Nannochloropsis gaditana]|uniref:Sedoheptulose--bisphosphatase n=1 Tax=Nannochloropsis gaditana TaxID=72520 RepID=W7TTI9_9STRA|nr:sedoheptulose- -bisphosphatase [Nannochloropsis gaditana]